MAKPVCALTPDRSPYEVDANGPSRQRTDVRSPCQACEQATQQKTAARSGELPTGVSSDMKYVSDMYPKVGVQFVQIGNDAAASEFLSSLDDNLFYRRAPFGTVSAKRDMVDTTIYQSHVPLTTLRLLKILLGGIDKRTDESRLRSTE